MQKARGRRNGLLFQAYQHHLKRHLVSTQAVALTLTTDCCSLTLSRA